jgi:hypothetical protein
VQRADGKAVVLLRVSPTRLKLFYSTLQNG